MTKNNTDYLNSQVEQITNLLSARLIASMSWCGDDAVMRHMMQAFPAIIRFQLDKVVFEPVELVEVEA